MNKSLSYVNLSLELHVVSTFWLDLTHQVLFLYILPSHHMNLRDQLWKMLILWCRTDICSSKFSAKVSLMLDNPFLVPSLCKLSHISLCFIQINTKSPAKLLVPFRESNVFFEVIPVVLGRSVNFNITKISIKTAHDSGLSVSCDYDLINKPNLSLRVFPKGEFIQSEKRSEM